MTTDNPSESGAAMGLEDMSRTDPPSAPTPFGGTNGNHLTVGMTGSGKSYSVARRAGAWWSQSDDRTLVVLVRNNTYNGVVGYCGGTQYTGMGLERATSDESLITPNGVTLATPGGYKGDETWEQVLSQFMSQFGRFAEEKPGETALIVDDIPIPTDHEHAQAYEQLLRGDENGQIWRVTQSVEIDQVPVPMTERDYIRQFQAIDLFGRTRTADATEPFDLHEPHRRYLLTEAGVTRTAEGGYSTGLGRSAPRDTWYQFKEEATDRERAMLEYRGDPFEFEIEGQL